MGTYKPIDSKREEFRKYLERAGVMDALTKVLVTLYEEPEKPANAMDYVRKHLGDDRPERCELDAALNDLNQAQTRIAFLEEEVAELKSKLDQMKVTSDETSQNADNI